MNHLVVFKAFGYLLVNYKPLVEYVLLLLEVIYRRSASLVVLPSLCSNCLA